MNRGEVDMVGGQYRRVYAGFISGRRICSVSIGAEAWFWRLTLLADDFGNLAADPTLLRGAAAGRRDVSVEQSEAWITELILAGLVTSYEIGPDRYLSIIGFVELQATKNGRRVRRCPAQPSCAAAEIRAPRIEASGESGGIQGSRNISSGESGGIQGLIRPHPYIGMVLVSSSDSSSDGISRPARLLWNQISDIYEAYPRHRRGGKGTFARAVAQAWTTAAASGDLDPAEILLSAVKAYAGSWAATNENGRACVGPAKFFDGVWNQDPADWAEPAVNGSRAAVNYAEAVERARSNKETRA
jgi:hypothetical protein